MNKDTIKLKLLIRLSKRIPKWIKIELTKRLISEKIPKGFLTKNIFAHHLYLDSYDLFTSSILSLHYNNGLSVDILNRVQIETIFLTDFLLKYPEKVKNIFSDEIFKGSKCYGNYYKKHANKQLKEAYCKFYSKKAHPLPKRFLSSLSFYTPLKPKSDNFDLKEFMSLTNEERSKRFGEFLESDGVSPSISGTPHNNLSEKQRENKLIESISLFDKITENLKKIEETCPDFDLNSQEWEEIIKKHKTHSLVKI